MNIDKKITYISAVLMSILYIAVQFPQFPWGLDCVFKYIGFYAVGNIFHELSMNKSLRKSNPSHILKYIEGGLAVVLIAINFLFAYHNLRFGIMWFVTGLLGTFGTAIVALLIDNNRMLQYLGRISLVVLCIHGPVYRVIIKIITILLHMKTNDVRTNFFLSMIVVIVTLAISSLAHEIIIKAMPWMIGKNKFGSILQK